MAPAYRPTAKATCTCGRSIWMRRGRWLHRPDVEGRLLRGELMAHEAAVLQDQLPFPAQGRTA
jgi:hypothetical protein